MIIGLLRNLPLELTYLVRRLRVQPGAPTMSVAEAATLRANGTRIVDVREPDDWDRDHIDDAVHIPLSQLGARLGQAPDGMAAWRAQAAHPSGTGRSP